MVRLRGNGYISPGDAEKVVRILKPRAITLHGWGEPLLHPYLSDIIASVKKYRVFTSLSTNGDYLTSSKLEKIIDVGLDELLFGFYMKNHLDNLYRVLDNLREIKRRYSRPRIIVDITLIKEFEDDARAIIYEISRIDVIDAVLLHRLFDLYGLKSGYKRLPPDKENDLVKYAKKVLKGKTLIPPPEHKIPCVTAWLGLFISWKLEVFPCCFLAVPSYFLGMVDNDQWKEHRKWFINSMREIEVCRKCPAP